MRLAYTRRRGLLWAGAALLIAVHIVAPDRAGVIGGVLPWDLAFHVAWMVAAGILIELIVRFGWRDVDGGADD